MSDDNWVLETIIALRGGVPETCSFCDKPFDSRGAIPEEAGDWACYVCWDRWEAQNAARAEEP